MRVHGSVLNMGVRESRIKADAVFQEAGAYGSMGDRETFFIPSTVPLFPVPSSPESPHHPIHSLPY